MTPDRRFPLRGIRVVDLTWAWAGPFASLQLVHLGAEVIKVESRARLDLTRTGPKLAPGASPNVRWNFNNFNQGKRSVTVNLGAEGGPELVRKLVEVSDIVVENMTPGVLQRFGLDYPALRARKPGIIMLSLSGFGADGPLSRRPVFGVPLLFMSGLASLTGYPGDVPRAVGVSYPDPVGGLHGAFAVMSALWHRNRTGVGQYIDLSELEATVAVLAEGVLPATTGNAIPERAGNRHATFAPHGCFPCAGDDQWLAIEIADDTMWGLLCNVAGMPALASDSRFATSDARKANEDELDATIANWTRTQERWAAARALQARGVAAFPTLTVADLDTDEHLAARGYFDTPEHPEVPGHRHPGIPWLATRTNDSIAAHAPQLGEANHYVFGELLGLPPGEITRLEQAEVLW